MRIYNTKFNVGDIINDFCIICRDCETGGKSTRFICECLKCGRRKSMTTSALSSQVGTTHKACSQGYVKEYPKLYYAWNESRMRIINPNNLRYESYGGRGLTHDYPLFIDFVDDMLESYLKAIACTEDTRNVTLGRIDNNKGYIKGNLRWETQKVQAMNKRTTVCFIATSPNGEKYLSKNAQIFAKTFNLDRSGINKVLQGKRKHYKGWKFERTLKMSVEAIERIIE